MQKSVKHYWVSQCKNLLYLQAFISKEKYMVAIFVSPPEQVLLTWKTNTTEKIRTAFLLTNSGRLSVRVATTCCDLGTGHKVFLNQLLNVEKNPIKRTVNLNHSNLDPQQIHKATIRAHSVICQHLNLTQSLKLILWQRLKADMMKNCWAFLIDTGISEQTPRQWIIFLISRRDQVKFRSRIWTSCQVFNWRAFLPFIFFF